MPIITYYGNVLCADSETGKVIQKPGDGVSPDEFVNYSILGDDRIDIEGLGVFELVKSEGDRCFFLRKDGVFMCAPPEEEGLVVDRTQPYLWEKFIVTRKESDALAQRVLLDFALERYKFGYIREALQSIERLHALYPENDDILTELVRLENLLDAPRRLSGQTTQPAKIFLNCDLPRMFEEEWIEDLLGSGQYETIGSAEGLRNQAIVVIDNYVRHEKVDFYRDLYRNHNRIMMIHLSDEVFQDDHRCYRWCHRVWRNLWSPLLARDKKVSFFPLGYKSGFRRNAGPMKTASQRRYVWFFAGDIKKSTRQSMYDNMSRIAGGKTHLTTYFGSSDALSVEEYRASMENSVFIPCGAGFVHLDSFRIYEALEAGCIPVVENGRDLDIFTPYLGSNPLPMVAHWDEAVPLIEGIIRRGEVEELRVKCHDWWTRHKAAIRTAMQADMAALPTLLEY